MHPEIQAQLVREYQENLRREAYVERLSVDGHRARHPHVDEQLRRPRWPVVLRRIAASLASS